MTAEDLSLPADYPELLDTLREQIVTARLRAHRIVNTALIELYWSIGNTILQRQKTQGWGNGVIGRLSSDLRAQFPSMTGLSRSNMYYMRSFAAGWPVRSSIVQQAVGQLPWGHIALLLDRLEMSTARDWYAAEAVAHGWSRNVLLNQIKNRTLERSGSAPSNFEASLPRPDSEFAQQIARDPYGVRLPRSER